MPEELRRRGGFYEQGRQVGPECGVPQMIKGLQSESPGLLPEVHRSC